MDININFCQFAIGIICLEARICFVYSKSVTLSISAILFEINYRNVPSSKIITLYFQTSSPQTVKTVCYIVFGSLSKIFPLSLSSRHFSFLSAKLNFLPLKAFDQERLRKKSEVLLSECSQNMYSFIQRHSTFYNLLSRR